MSSLFPERMRRSVIHAVLPGAVVAVAAMGSTAQAAQTYFQPQVETSVEQNTNRNLSINPADEADITGYVAEAQFTWGYVTPKTDATVRPRIRFQRYPDREEVERTEQFLDLNSLHRITERSTFDLVGRYAREDSFNSELDGAEFDDIDPEDPTEGGGSTELVSGETRTRVQLRPGFTHEISDVTGIRVEASYEDVSFDSDTRNRRDYDNLGLRALVTRQVTPLTRLSAGPTAKRFETSDGRNTTDTYGIELGMAYRWSELTRVAAGISLVQSDFDFFDEGIAQSDSETNVGFNFNVTRRTETGRFRLVANRGVRPSSGGRTVIEDQLRFQHDYNFSERLSLRTAVLASTREAQGDVQSDRNEDYARAEIGLMWMITPTIFVRGGYEYTWREIELDGTSAKNHMARITLGYRGLGRPE
jgi:hypothetical protein